MSDTNAKASVRAKHPGWRDVLRSLRQRKVAVMLLLGLSAGLPFMLVGNTMGLWLREGGIELTTIGFLSWVGIMYSMKFLWAPIIDKTDVPILGRLLGHRRGWMVLAQIVVAAGLTGMALITPQGGLMAFASLALLAAFASATQDIVIDAWRIESADNGEELSLLSAAYQLGYRFALLLTDAWILVIAAKIGWTMSYELVAGLMGLGMIAVLFARESREIEVGPVVALPDPRDGRLGVSDAMVVRWMCSIPFGLFALVQLAFFLFGGSLLASFHVSSILLAALAFWLLIRRPAGPVAEATWSRPLVRPLLKLFDAVIGPFIVFFREHGKAAALILLAISVYRLPDFVLGPMANPFYNDLGIAKETVGAVRGSVGWIATTVGIVIAGISALRFGFVTTLMLGAILGPGSNLAFAWLAYHGADPTVFSIVMIIDNFCTGFAGVALVGYMSSLTSQGYTATQYALLSSFYALPGKFLKGLSGAVVDGLAKTTGSLIDAYAIFFIGTAVVGIPALLLCIWLVRHARTFTAPATASG
jgi:MFS transporter, PAT family, beta-lactamase induction signal transducer AmpG